MLFIQKDSGFMKDVLEREREDPSQCPPPRLAICFGPQLSLAVFYPCDGILPKKHCAC